MKREDISTLRMIASNCSLEKVQREMLQDIAKREEQSGFREEDGWKKGINVPEDSRQIELVSIYYSVDPKKEPAAVPVSEKHFFGYYNSKDGFYYANDDKDEMEPFDPVDVDFWRLVESASGLPIKA